MLTRQGRWVAIAAVAAVAAGRLLGIVELWLLAAGAATVVVLAVVRVALAHLRLDVDRQLRPRHVHAGGDSHVDLEVRNRGRRRTPLLTLRDPVGPERAARVLLAPLSPGEPARATYRLPTDRRGILTVGPLEIEVSDPFGLAAVRTEVADATELTVYPAVENVVPPPLTRGDDPLGVGRRSATLASAGEEFHALRRYEVGDDLRRVHWPASARQDELMVRQEELPFQGRATILLDVRGHAHTEETLEMAVSAAASLVVACRRRRYLLRMLASDGSDSGWGTGSAHVETLLERLATVRPTDAAGLGSLVAKLHRTGDGAVVALVGGRRGVQVAPLGPAAARREAAVTVVFAPGRHPDAGVLATDRRLVVDEASGFAAPWNAAMQRRGPVAAGAAR